jgi:hypothetical protein
VSDTTGASEHPDLRSQVDNWATPRFEHSQCAGTRHSRDETNDTLYAQTRAWSTRAASREDGRQTMLHLEASNWGTPRANEWKGTGPKGSDSQQYRLDKGYLDAQVEEYADESKAVTSLEPEKRSLNPDWEEILMGWPIGWTDPEKPCSGQWPGWPAGQGTFQYEYEPLRTLPRGAMRNRTGRVKAIGNGVVPQSAEAAFVRLLTEMLM